ncbi:carboxypeptidase regulatory-like domain-containing protein [Pleurocapsa sp. PCC 7319]|uniref:carboxypeptidase regulatory-like domain-containing protein n=1 Tax=Pleurocapsa sp. PCC 7319 TaxID=118161 RepID=UPI00034A9D72|nr:carboxypeptidase regulatory-like domain-containing protein [Pleurocapsa sp. PCC 7319]
MPKVIINRRVAIAGKVNNSQTNRAIAMAQVKIIDAPETFVSSLVTTAKLVVSINETTEVKQARTTLKDSSLSKRQKLEAARTILDLLTARQILTNFRTDVTLTAGDGLFYFLNLPPGEYSLQASMPNMTRRYGIGSIKTVTVSDRGNTQIAVADLTLPSTNLTGKITHNAEPITLAEVRIKGSQESAFSNSKGEYIFSELESSARSRIILVRAKGYQPSEKKILLSRSGEQKTLNFDLTTGLRG